METSNFEAVKVAIKQDSSGYILTLRMHPDEARTWPGYGALCRHPL